MNLTAEQRAALELAIDRLKGEGWDDSADAIRRLSAPAWQITEERKEALRFGIAVLVGIKSTHRTELLTMLAEAEALP